MTSEQESDYGKILSILKEKIRLAKQRASWAVNTQLLQVYWDIGKAIADQENSQGWGAKTVEKLSKDLRFEFSDMKGISPRNLRYMRDFAKAYPHFPFWQAELARDRAQSEILQAGLAKLETVEIQGNTTIPEDLIQISWYHHITLLDKVKEPEARKFYIQKTIQNGWTRDMLVHQIETGLHLRQGALTHNFKTTLPVYQSEFAQQLFKDPYHFDFLMIGASAKERDLENALISHITKVLIELGDGFGFMGRQYRLEAGGQEYFLDLLFYHTKLRRHVVIELKIGDFMPEYAGKMNFYLGLADDKLRGPHDEPAIGLILCKTKNKIIAEYALRDTSKPIGIAEYKISEMLPEDIKGELPTIEEIEHKLELELENPKSQLEIKLSRIKHFTSEIKGDSLKEKNKEYVVELFEVIIPKIQNRVEELLESLFKEFTSHKISRIVNEQTSFTTSTDLEAKLLNENVHRLGLHIELNGFIKAKTKTFNVWRDLKFELYQYYYYIKTYFYEDFLLSERLYDQPWTDDEINQIAEKFAETIADDVSGHIERIKTGS
jgi:predicted nuclease of restriction endonuclease-like (RecB) superfamily